MTQRPVGWVEGILVPASTAPGLSALLDQGRGWARANGIVLPDDVAEVVAAVDAVAQALRQRAASRADVLMSSRGSPQSGGLGMVTEMTTSEFALLAGCSRRHATRLAARRLHGARRVGSAWVFDRAAVEAALADRKATRG